MHAPARIAVFASGGGTNLQALIDRFHGDPGAPARVELLVASRPEIGALKRAGDAEIPSVVLSPGLCEPGTFPERLLAELRARAIDLIVLAGYLQLVPEAVVAAFHGRMLNIHPALLPAFGGHGMYGMRVHRAVIASGARVSGATVHLVDERYDEGRILAQWPVPVLAGDTPETLAARVLRVEHALLPAAVVALVRQGRTAALGDPAAFELIDRPAPDGASVGRLTG